MAPASKGAPPACSPPPSSTCETAPPYTIISPSRKRRAFPRARTTVGTVGAAAASPTAPVAAE
eukprot:CAMPEP_0172633580 /NCGR_PEP_ID=MMETSP1068-20121228/190082_1 /TAXON_ID=35684 /ORGANISM="Pseudopedinella elastica, Strain CCMP716" /LENGTH=62 /DNA_ID=CAMNT_0013445305 /DNA_START=17 /DNA_END=205 /DNA_ORIENTATION=+